MSISVTSIAILGLFAFLVVMGLMSDQGSVCGRGWLAFFMLPLAAAVSYMMIINLMQPAPAAGTGPASEGAEGTGGPQAEGPQGASPKFAAMSPSLMGYAAFLAIAQYIMTAVFVMVQKPTVGRMRVFQKSFVAAGIIFGLTMLAVAGAKAIPGMAVLQWIPGVGKWAVSTAIMGMATSPMLIIGALAAHGISCSVTN